MIDEKEMDRLFDEAKRLDSDYHKRQSEIRVKVLADVPSQIKMLEGEKARLKESYLGKRRELSDEIKVIRGNRRKMTKEAYLKDEKLQQLKKDKNLKWEESRELTRKKWKEEEITRQREKIK